MPKYPADDAFIGNFKDDVERHLRLLTRENWTVELCQQKRPDHLRFFTRDARKLLVSESAIRRLLVKKFYRVHTALDPLLLTRQGLMMDIVTRTIRQRFAKPELNKKHLRRCPECLTVVTMNADICIYKQCDGCNAWFARDAFPVAYKRCGNVMNK